jgi:antitoxin component YwqK of YwqJK toxin-antitoxin module
VKKLRKTINYVNIRNEVAYEVNSDTPYTGLYRGLKPDVDDDHTSTLFVGEFKNGLREGKCTSYRDRQKQEEGNYLDGKQAGKHTRWYVTGQKQKEGNYLDGKQAGKHTRWYVTGQKQKEGNYLDGKLVGKFTQWHQNGGKKGAQPTSPEENKRPECVLCGTALLLSFIFYCVYVFIDKVFGVLF